MIQLVIELGRAALAYGFIFGIVWIVIAYPLLRKKEAELERRYYEKVAALYGPGGIVVINPPCSFFPLEKRETE